MSSLLIQSEQDSSSSLSSSLSSSDEEYENHAIQDASSVEPKIPLSTSVFLERLPTKQKILLQRTVSEQNDFDSEADVEESVNLSEPLKERIRKGAIKSEEDGEETQEKTEEDVNAHNAEKPEDNQKIDDKNVLSTTKESFVSPQATTSTQENPEGDAKASESTSATSPKTSSTKSTEIPKITIRFVPIGSTPRITSAVFTISSNQTVSTLTKFLGKMLKTKEHVYVYIQNSFQPNPDEKLNDLYHLFKTNNELIVSYCQSVAFG